MTAFFDETRLIQDMKELCDSNSLEYVKILRVRYENRAGFEFVLNLRPTSTIRSLEIAPLLTITEGSISSAYAVYRKKKDGIPNQEIVVPFAVRLRAAHIQGRYSVPQQLRSYFEVFVRHCQEAIPTISTAEGLLNYLESEGSLFGPAGIDLREFLVLMCQ